MAVGVDFESGFYSEEWRPAGGGRPRQIRPRHRAALRLQGVQLRRERAHRPGRQGDAFGLGLVLGLFADGVARMLELLNEELKRAMIMAGCANIASISEEIPIPR